MNKLAIFVLSLVLLSGCATIFKGKHAEVRLNSSPSGATILINDIDKGQTPTTLNLKRNKDYIVTFRKDGYEDVKVEINKKFDFGTTIVGNIFLWGLIGIVVDLANGSAYSLSPADFQANLAELQAAGFIPEGNDYDESDIHVVMLTPEQWTAITANK